MPDYLLNEGYKNNKFIFEKALGSKIYCKNKKYIDLSFSAGSLLLGHQSKIFRKSINNILKNKLSILASPNKQAMEYSLLLKKIYPRYSKFIFCSTGSEAVLKSLRIARALSKNKIIISVTGSWHGSNDKTLFAPNNKLVSIPMSEGLSKEDQTNIKFIPYNNKKKSLKILNKYNKKISCIIIEPIQAGLPDPNAKDYLEFLYKYSKSQKKILVFDETITGIRTGCSSVQQIYKLKPDITTFGKCFGGGMPIGVIALTKRIEKKLSSSKTKVFFGGTFSGNSLSTFVGKETVTYIFRNKKKIFLSLKNKSNYFLNKINKIINQNKLNISIFSFYSMFRIIFTKEKVKNRIQRDFFEKKNFKKINLFRKFLFKHSIYYPNNGIIFFSCQTSLKDIDKIIRVFEAGLLKYFKK